MNFPSDSSKSTQTNNGTSYAYANSSDSSTKPDLLYASTNLLGIRRSITSLNYSASDITLNKPTIFKVIRSQHL